MDGFEGYLQVPPDRSQILGRQSWKTRYVVAGSRQTTNRDRQGSYCFSYGPSGRVNSALPKLPDKVLATELTLSVYKTKDDKEPICQWPLASISECQVQLMSYRKQGPPLATLVITISDKHKRRSSRAPGFISGNKETGAVTLWFRDSPDDHSHSLQDWAQCIMRKKASTCMMSSPTSPIFTMPFQSRADDDPDSYTQMGSGTRVLQHKSSTATYSSGPLDRSATFSSESHSLRSKRSDISSPSSTFHLQKATCSVPGQNYTTTLPNDIVPATPNVEHREKLIEGWTSAQDRSPTISPTATGRGSASSNNQQFPTHDVTSPPAPGETILDRAFQLGQIPGAENFGAGHENLSSIARFDALMREAEERQRLKATDRQAEQAAMQSAFDDDYSSDDDDCGEIRRSDESLSEGNSLRQSPSNELQSDLISPGAQRALAYIMGRKEARASQGAHRPAVSRAHLSFHAISASESSTVRPLRPHTANAKNRQNLYLAQTMQRPIPPATKSDYLLAGKQHDDGHQRSRSTFEDRHSPSSAKRLSFTEFARRLSSTSSLLLVQAHANGGSGRVSSEADIRTSSASRTNLSLRGEPASRSRCGDDHEDRQCRWRGNVGAIGTDGGFI